MVFLDAFETIHDGHSLSWKIPPGHYQLEMTATNDGAGVEWVGANCGQAQEVRNFATRCELVQTGQLVINNPSNFGLGADTTVTVKVTRLPN